MATTAQQSGDNEQVSLAGACDDCHIEEVLDKLERELVGLRPVKTRIREIAALLLVDRLRKQMNLSAGAPTLHMSFTGNPGTGKTTVALRMAEILHRLGYIRRPEVISVTRDDLVGQYIGHTAPKTKEVLKKAMGGVLFIDEAYYLYKPENERDYGQESIEILLQVMENNRDDLVVILAGYKDKMDKFFQSNPGMRSRIAHHIDFPDYAQDELMEIARLLLEQQQYRFSEDAARAFHEYIGLRMKMPQFANARSIRNALDRARLRHANRIYARGGKVTKHDLMTIEAEDILASRVFSEGKPDDVEEQAQAEKKSLKKTEIENPAPRNQRAADHEYDTKQDEPMQTTTGNSEITRGVMPHAAPVNGHGKRWENRSKRRADGHAAPTPPRYEDMRPAPTVVNGRCEFGQCEDGAESTPSAETAMPQQQPAPASAAAPAQQSATSGFGVPREQHAPRVVVRRAPRNTSRDSAPPPRVERPAPVVTNGRCEFGSCDAPSKVEEMATGRGQIVTGNSVERSARVTGNEPGTCKNVTGTEYTGPDQYQQFCASQGGLSVVRGRTPGATGTQPAQAAPRTGMTRTTKNKTVTGVQVGRSPKVTGDEPGSCKHITGDEYINPAAADVPCAGESSPGPAKVNVSRTSHGRGVTGTLVGHSGKITGDEYGACKNVTGTEYIGAELQQEFCAAAPAPAPEKVGVARTWLGQDVSGTQVGQSAKVTGDEYGACKPVTGTAYIGADSYAVFCAPAAQQAAAERAKPVSGTPGHVITGSQPGLKGKMTGDERGACAPVSGTPYVGGDQYGQACGTGASAAAVASGAFSIAAPAHAARQSRAGEITGTAYGNGAGRITGPLAKSAGTVTGTAEFRYPEYNETAPQQPAQKTSRVTGEGTEARRITGDDWTRTLRTTGTEGRSALARNLTQRGQPRGAAASARGFREVEHPDVPPSKITGSSGNSTSGSLITLSGGARG